MRLLASLVAIAIGVMLFTAGAPAPAQSSTGLTPAGEGRRVYLQYNCYGCHGTRAQGGMGPNIVHAESGDLREVVMEGGDSGMPSYAAYLSTTDVNNLIAYLSSIGTPNEPMFNDWWVPNPTK